MADFKNVTSTICGAASGLNDVLNGIDDFGDELLKALEEGPAKLASEVVGDTVTKLDDAESALAKLVPKIPTLKDLGLQDEVDTLKGLVGDAIAYADKVTSIAAAFGEMDFEKIMLATCDADNLKIDSKGRLVKIAKNVTGDGKEPSKEKGLPEGIITIGDFILSSAESVGDVVNQVKDGVTLVKGEVADIQGKVTTLATGYTDVKVEIDRLT